MPRTVFLYSTVDLFLNGLRLTLSEHFSYTDFFSASKQSLSKLNSCQWDLAVFYFASYSDFLQASHEFLKGSCPSIVILRRFNEEILKKLSERPGTVIFKEDIEVSDLILAAEYILKKGRADARELKRLYPHLAEKMISTQVLTVREKEIVYLLAKGFTAYSIGMALGISVHTVRNHVNRIYAKLGVNDRVSAIIKALSLGLINDLLDPEDDEKEGLSEP